MLQNGCRPAERFHIEDADGEHAFIHAGDIALLEVPIFILDQDERDAIGEDKENGVHDEDLLPPLLGGSLSLVHSQSDDNQV